MTNRYVDDLEDVADDAVAGDVDVVADDDDDIEPTIDDADLDDTDLDDAVITDDDDADNDDEDDDRPSSSQEDEEESDEALDELEAEELEMLTDDEESEILIVDEAAELRAIRRAELAMEGDGGTERGADEFVCGSCFLVLKRSQLASSRLMLCRDCAA